MKMRYRGVSYDRQPAIFNPDCELAGIQISQIKFRGQTYQQQIITFASPEKSARFLGQIQNRYLASPTKRNIAV